LSRRTPKAVIVRAVSYGVILQAPFELKTPQLCRRASGARPNFRAHRGFDRALFLRLATCE
jgi:hypothetical protein